MSWASPQRATAHQADLKALTFALRWTGPRPLAASLSPRQLPTQCAPYSNATGHP